MTVVLLWQHGCRSSVEPRFGFWGFKSVGNTMIGEFILAAAAELKQAILMRI